VTTAVVKKSAKPKPKTGGRALMLLDEVKRDELINLIVLGMPVNKAVAMVNISESTFYNWMSRGMVERDRLATIIDAKNKPEEKIYLDFLEALPGHLPLLLIPW
jgi:DNA invertase Pin-like site-specific DNA recombinase